MRIYTDDPIAAHELGRHFITPPLGGVDFAAGRLPQRRPQCPRGAGFAAQVQMVFQDPYASLHPRHTIDRTLSEPLAIHGLPLTDADGRIQRLDTRNLAITDIPFRVEDTRRMVEADLVRERA